MNYYLGIDVGHTKIKAGLFGADGKLNYLSTKETPFESDVIDTEVLWHCVAECIKNIVEESEISPEFIKAVSVSGHGNGLYMLDKRGKPFAEAYSATYDAGKDEVNLWLESDIDKELHKYILQDIWAGQPLSILAYIKKEKPHTYNDIGTILFCKDYINYRLTGNVATDYTDASAAGIMNNFSGKYDKKIFENLGLKEIYNVLPTLKKSTDVLGKITEEVADITGLSKSTVVSVGMFDAVAALIGSGAYESGVCGIISGTWGINSLIAEEVSSSQKFLQCTRFIDGERFLYIESAPTSSSNIEWMLNNVFPHISYREADDIAAKFSAADVYAIYKPYINGNLGEGVSAAFCDLSYRDNMETMIRAVYEGIAFGHRKQVDTLVDSGAEFEKIVLSGGGAKSDIRCKIMSDVLGKIIYVPQISDSGILGNAIIAMISKGEVKNLNEFFGKTKIEYKTYYPDRENQKIYNEKYKRFLER